MSVESSLNKFRATKYLQVHLLAVLAVIEPVVRFLNEHLSFVDGGIGSPDLLI